MKKISRSSRVLAAAALGWCAPAAAAEIVKLQTGITIRVESVTREGDSYRLVLPSLPNDPLRVPASDIACMGSDCVAQADPTPTASPEAKPAKPAAPALKLSGRIGVYGSNTIGAVLMQELIKAFGEKYGYSEATTEGQPNEFTLDLTAEGEDKASASFDLQAKGSGTGIPALYGGQAQIAMLSRPIQPSEIADGKTHGMNLTDEASQHVLAMDGIAIVINRANTIGALSTEQVAKIFAGKISDWKEVGGPPGEIDLFRRDDVSGTTDTFETLVMKPNNESKMSITATEFSGRSEDLVSAVAQDPKGIGYIGWAYAAANSNVKPLAILTKCGVPVKPSEFGIKTEEYPLTRRLFIYTDGEPKDALARQLKDYALSAEAQSVIDKFQFVSQANKFLSFDMQLPRIMQIAFARDPSPQDTRQFIADVQSASRASITFHFEAGGSQLDAKGLADLKRLADELASPGYKDRRFIVAGFTSEKEVPAAQQADLSQKRARDIAKALAIRHAQFYSDNVIARGYGPGAPVACSDSPLNQRVEIWMLD